MKVKHRPFEALRYLATVIILICLAGCDKPPVIPESERVMGLMSSGTWKINSVTIDGVVDGSFKDMTLVFTKTSFTTTNGGIVWPASGTWSFTSEAAKAIKRNDNVESTVDLISGTAFTLSLTWTKTTLGGGRQNSVAGKHIFMFKK